MIPCFRMKVFAAVLLLLIVSDCHSEVVKSFTETCPQFFAYPNGVLSPPTIFDGSQYKQICQKLNNTNEFATLYDTANKIPVYSAYRFTGRGDCSRSNHWYIEPQLDDQNAGPNMETSTGNQLLQNQAVNKDYEGSGYDKGHLVPVYHAKDKACVDATFTLTNAAPQNGSFNRGQWKVAEKKVAKFVDSECKHNKTYIVTGVIPGQERIINNRVNVPSYYWSGFCCLDNNNKAKISGGFYGENKKKKVSDVTLQELDSKLTALYKKKSFSVFTGGCYLPKNEPDMWLLYKECMDKGGKLETFILAKKCFGENPDKVKISRCIDKWCPKKKVYLNRKRLFVTRQRYRP